ncbi:MAG: lipoprotein insertase outer membrane protein LolB [Gammaproteobacteria bacterium]
MKLARCAVYYIAAFHLVLLSACTTVNKPTPVDDPELEWAVRQTQLNKISQWKINGRLAITNEAEVWHLSVIWNQQDQRYKIHLSGPFGAGAVQLTGDQTGVMIKSDGETTHANNAEQLLLEKTGVQIPVKDLFYWVRGLPNPESNNTNIKLDPYGRLNTLSQNNWKIRFKRYNTTGTIDLPSKIFIKRESLDIRFVIEEWSFSS